jgi:uncharacterized Zn finger protein
MTMLAAVRRLLGEQVFARGQTYERQGRVRSLVQEETLVLHLCGDRRRRPTSSA